MSEDSRTTGGADCWSYSGDADDWRKNGVGIETWSLLTD